MLLPLSQRWALRHDVRFECEVVRERDFKLIGKRAVDLSPHGMMVLLSNEVLTGEDVLVTFKSPGTDRYIDAEAKVARVVHGRRPGDFGRAIGLEFRKIDRLSMSYVHEGLRRVAPRAPGRRIRYDYAGSVRAIAQGEL